MNRPSAVFIRTEHRPDLRAAMGPDLRLGFLSPASCFSTFPRSFQLKGCVEKGDPDKDKEIAKDDQARGPVRDRSVAARDGAIANDQSSECAYTTIFA
jgi:hypothetical protein